MPKYRSEAITNQLKEFENEKSKYEDYEHPYTSESFDKIIDSNNKDKNT